MTHLVVVPSAFVSVLRAEHTIAVLCFLIQGLATGGGLSANTHERWRGPIAYRTTLSVIWVGNFPILVPPNFCTIQPPRALFFCKAGGAITGAGATAAAVFMVSVRSSSSSPYVNVVCKGDVEWGAISRVGGGGVDQSKRRVLN